MTRASSTSRRSTATSTCSIPARFPYGEDTHYRPAGQETGTAEQLLAGDGRLRHAARADRRAELRLRPRQPLPARRPRPQRRDAARGSPSSRTTSARPARALRAAGIVGVAWNVTYLRRRLLRRRRRRSSRRAARSTCSCNCRSSTTSSLPLVPMLERSGVRVLVDHCGRPTIDAGLDQPGFRALLGLAATRRAFVKLSGLVKFSREPSPHDDARPFVTRWSTRSRSIVACGRRTGRTCARRRASTTACCSRSSRMSSRTTRQRRRVLWDTPAALLHSPPDRHRKHQGRQSACHAPIDELFALAAALVALSSAQAQTGKTEVQWLGQARSASPRRGQGDRHRPRAREDPNAAGVQEARGARQGGPAARDARPLGPHHGRAGAGAAEQHPAACAGRPEQLADHARRAAPGAIAALQQERPHHAGAGHQGHRGRAPSTLRSMCGAIPRPARTRRTPAASPSAISSSWRTASRSGTWATPACSAT